MLGRKYRDERRPRAGLLRGIEFTMQDLYTFDCDEETAISTYYDICKQYQILFEELRIPYILVCVILAYYLHFQTNLSRLKRTVAAWEVACHMSFTTLLPLGKM